MKTGDAMKMMVTGAIFVADEIGIMCLDKVLVKEFGFGEVGYIIGGIKLVVDVCVGDMIMFLKNFVVEALSGYLKSVSMVFAGIFFIDID